MGGHLRGQYSPLRDLERGRPLVRAGDWQFIGERVERKYFVILRGRAGRIAERAVHDHSVALRPLKLDDLLDLLFLSESVPQNALEKSCRRRKRHALVLSDRIALLDEHEIAGVEKVLGQGYAADF
jgi:hypothetical protein